MRTPPTLTRTTASQLSFAETGFVLISDFGATANNWFWVTVLLGFVGDEGGTNDKAEIFENSSFS